ncbi:MAG: helix-turn-helix transcriptional regulator [Treponema sp.]|uniref:helix-turn-helix domain-containing protein n=1 Tax=Treponema sp. TaxID=166 RepID=UPI00298E0767|nr:helix-turn-helix transcriptional regulator [Treponema sp.]MDD5812263.1 helix-turn-helix transcriptional regulator [Treponema sp.]
MDQIKIGKFIGEQRKVHNLTQSELSEKLGITDRAISKWERGICLPDAGLMLDLCKILEISVNELLTGEKIPMENNTEIMEKNLIEMAALNERTNKMLIHTEYILIALMVFIVIAGALVSSYLVSESWLRAVIMGICFLLIFVIAPFCWRIETKTGYYQCSECGHKYVPTYKASIWSPHMGTTKYMKCPECGKKSWQKKVLK